MISTLSLLPTPELFHVVCGGGKEFGTWQESRWAQYFAQEYLQTELLYGECRYRAVWSMIRGGPAKGQVEETI